MSNKNLFLLDSYDYFLPEERIAQSPADKRQNSRLLYLDRKTGAYRDLHFADITELIPENALIVANNSKVIPARITGHRKTGSQLEMLFLEPAPLIDKKAEQNGNARLAVTEVLLKGAKRVKIGESLDFPEMTVTVLERHEFGKHIVQVRYAGSLIPLLKQYGSLPLPPYIKREHGVKEEDFARYQTVYAKEQNIGSIAAPTAGLHFTEELRQKLLDKGCEWQEVTLHVGYGTFSPVRADDIRNHAMHAEYVEISPQAAHAVNKAKQEKRPVIAVGTTGTRSLEGMAQAYANARAGKENTAFFCGCEQDLTVKNNETTENVLPEHGCFGHTDIFIYPGKEFHVIDGLITNFHLPKSSLIMLVSAFAGYDEIMNAYAHAVQEKYRFFSYGDAMFIF